MGDKLLLDFGVKFQSQDVHEITRLPWHCLSTIVIVKSNVILEKLGNNFTYVLSKL